MKHELLIKMLENYASTTLKKRAQDVDEQERFPTETVAELAKYGLLGLPYPTTYGGVGADTKAYIDAVRITSQYCATTGVIISAHTSLCASPIYAFGTEEQKQKYLTKLNTGEYLGAFGLTEAGAGTDASAQQTKAIDCGDYYEVTGNKIFITNAGYADVYIIFAMTNPELGLKGISAFIVEKILKASALVRKKRKWYPQ